MTTVARDALTAHFQAKKAKGLKDLKFFFGNLTKTTVEEVCGVVNKVYGEVEKNNFIVQKSWGDSQRTRTTA